MKLKEIFFPDLYEAGQPVSKKVFYHGTPHKFEHFDLDYIGKGNDQEEFGRHIVMLNPEKIKIIDRLSPLNEIELGGGLDSIAFDEYKTDLEKADYSGHKQYDLFPEIPTLTMPDGYERVGTMDGYIIVRKKEPYQDFDRRIGTLPGYMYILVKNTKPIGYCYTVLKNINYPELAGKGMMTKNVYIDDSERGKNLALKFYYWLLTHVCDYIIPDDTHTHDGAALWRRLNQSSKFDMYVFNPETGMSRKRWAGKDWNQIYKNDYLQPFLCLKGRWVDTDDYESQFEDDD